MLCVVYLLGYGLSLGGGLQMPEGTWIDLTHAFSEDTIYWPTADGFRLEVDFAGPTEQGYYYEANSFKAAEHGGTHLDAPSHFAEGRHRSDEIPLDRLIGPAAVVDVSAKALNNPDYQVSVEDFLQWEAKNGKLKEGVILLLYTGFGKYWPDRKKYMGTDQRGSEAVPKLHFPGLHPDAASWLVAQRKISAIGLDTPSIDYGQSKLFKSHRILFDRNIPAFENVANLHRMPPKGALVIALPMKIKKGSGGPLRIVALLPD